MFLENKIKEIRKIRADLPKQAKKVAENHKKTILDYIRINQLFDKGIDGKGKKLKKYTPFTVAIKKLEGKNPNIVTLNDTGDFYRDFDLFYTDQNSIGIFSRNEKTPELIEKYGQNIFTFTVNNIKEINNEIFIPKLIEWIMSTDTFTKI